MQNDVLGLAFKSKFIHRKLLVVRGNRVDCDKMFLDVSFACFTLLLYSNRKTWIVKVFPKKKGQV